MRPLVSYDDIASQTPQQTSAEPHEPHDVPPKKRRKMNHRQGQRQGSQYARYHNAEYKEEHKGSPKKTWPNYGLKEESRQLTYEEVWDDSALIRAWDAAAEEYEVLNGSDKKWKSEPVNKSALWFNIPPRKDEPSNSPPGPSFMPSIPAVFASQGHEIQDDPEADPTDPENSRPVDFNTFVPQHDPSLSLADAKQGATGTWPGIVPQVPPGMTNQVTRNEAFEHAMGAWYWAGYWTGVYHSVGNKGTAESLEEGGPEGETTDEVMDGMVEQDADSEGDEERDLVPT